MPPPTSRGEVTGAERVRKRAADAARSATAAPPRPPSRLTMSRAPTAALGLCRLPHYPPGSHLVARATAGSPKRKKLIIRPNGPLESPAVFCDELKTLNIFEPLKLMTKKLTGIVYRADVFIQENSPC